MESTAETRNVDQNEHKSDANIGLAPPGLGKSLEVQILAAEYVLRSREPVLLITPGDQDNSLFTLGDDGDLLVIAQPTSPPAEPLVKPAP